MGSSKVDINDLVFVVIPGRLEQAEGQALYTRVFEFWKQEWQRVFAGIDPLFQLDEADFLRQTKVCAILAGDEVVGLQTLGVHEISDFLNQDYFKPYTVEFLQALHASGVRKFQTMQYFLVSEKWNARTTGQNFAAIVLGLSFNHQIADQLDATITLARKDVAATSTASKFNMNQLGSNIQMHNVPVGQLLCTQPGLYPRPEVNQAVESLWARRQDFCRDFSQDYVFKFNQPNQLEQKLEEKRRSHEPVRNSVPIEN